MTILEQSRESMPAANLRAERLFLSACLLANAKDREELVLLLSSADFHDPWHAWLLLAIRHGRRLNGREFLEAILKEAMEAKPPVSRPVAYELAAMVYDAMGMPIAGDVAKIRRYAADVKFAAGLRDKQRNLERQLLAVMNEAEEHDRTGDNDF